MVSADLVMLPLALWSAYMLRLAEPFPPAMQSGWWLFLLVPIAGVYIFGRLGLYRAVVRYMGGQAIGTVAAGVLILAAVLFLASFLTVERTPRSIPFIFAAVALVYVGGSRFFVRAWYQMMIGGPRHGAEPVIIFGAGVSGAHLAKSLKGGDRYLPVAFIDEDPGLHGSVIDGIPIHAPRQIPDLLETFAATRVLLAIPSASRTTRRRILDLLERHPVHVQTIPAMDELVDGKARINQLRDIDVGDLLGRDPVPPVPELLARDIAERSVLVSGAGGSIGSELCRKILVQEPKVLVLYERNEYALYTIEAELLALKKARGIATALIPILGSISNSRRVKSALRHFKVQTVYHAAAYKHVPMVEHNILEGVENNVFGTRVLAEASAECGVERFVLISTDKAVRPSNVMGATKRLAELVLQEMSARPDCETVFTMVRFGNVLGSSGSVVPLFHRQIGEGGPVTVTHPDITRYFMTTAEAADLVIQAGAMATGGEVYVLDMGEPVKIIDLAHRMIRLHGLRVQNEQNPHGIRLEINGLRPGEKLFEELLIGQNVSGTSHPKIMRADEETLSSAELGRLLQDLQEAVTNTDPQRAHEVLRSAVAEFNPRSGPSDWIPATGHDLPRFPVPVPANSSPN